jgi:hypothetical protein
MAIKRNRDLTLTLKPSTDQLAVRETTLSSVTFAIRCFFSDFGDFQTFASVYRGTQSSFETLSC